MNERARSVPGSGKSFSVNASPFNAVKLSLGVVIVVGVILVLVTGRLTASTPAQLLLLCSYGAIAAFWLVHQTRRVLREQTRILQSSEEKSSINVSNEK